MHKILIVEDESDEARSMQLILEDEGYNVTVVETVSAGFKELRIKKYNLVLLDIILPLQLGNKLLEKMKEREINVPVIVITAISDKLTGVEKDLRKINHKIGFVQKPFTAKKLVSEVKKYLK